MQWGFPIVSNNILQLYLAIGFPYLFSMPLFAIFIVSNAAPLIFPFLIAPLPLPPPPHRTPPHRMDSKQSGIVV